MSDHSTQDYSENTSDYDVGTSDYIAKLQRDYEDIKARVERGMLPLVARIPAVEKAVSEYVEAQDEDFERKWARARAEGRNGDNAVPIQLRDADALHKFADLVLHEELTWSHPDKMSIVEYPIMSGWQKLERNSKQILPGEITFRDRQHNGRRKSHYIGRNGEMMVANPKMPDKVDDAISDKLDSIEVKALIDSANLTDRQREVIELVYFGDMTQEKAADVLGIRKSAVNEHLSIALRKLREKTVLLSV